MLSYPNRCQHLKVNGTQCGSPALRRNKFCFFHKRWQTERIQLNASNHKRRARCLDLPVLEDANSIQITLMQVMRMIVSREIDSKTAGLLLYALQTASFNLRHTDFEPVRHQRVVVDLGDVVNSPLGSSEIWSDEDYEEEEEAEEVEVGAETPVAASAKPEAPGAGISKSGAPNVGASNVKKTAGNGKKPPQKVDLNQVDLKKIDLKKVRRDIADLIVKRLPDAVEAMQRMPPGAEREKMRKLLNHAGTRQ